MEIKIDRYTILVDITIILETRLDVFTIMHCIKTLETTMFSHRRSATFSMPLSLALLIGLTACSASSEPSCKSRTATETLRQGIEQNLLGMKIYGQGVQVTNVEGSPVEQLQFGIVCQAVVDISGVDLANLSVGGEKPSSKVVKSIQIKVAYRVDKVDGELVTRWDASNLFQVVGMAAAFRAAEEADPGVFGRILGTPGR